jgi:hypothetical protein
MPTRLAIQPWPDPVIDTLGHDPRSLYVERFWLPTLGPTSLLLLRRIAELLDQSPDGAGIDVAETSAALGVGHREGKSSPFMRSMDRLVQFDLACATGPDGYAVRRSVPPVNRRHLHRLPDSLRDAHTEWTEAQLAEPPLAAARRKARRLAFALFEQGDDLDCVERVLHTVGFHPTICRESAVWAYERHRSALEAATQQPTNETAVAHTAA